MKFSNLGIIAIAVISFSALLTFLDHYSLLNVPELVLMFSRWLAIVGLFLYGFKKKSLTTWILISMVVGAEIGHDFPEVGIKLQVLTLARLTLRSL